MKVIFICLLVLSNSLEHFLDLLRRLSFRFKHEAHQEEGAYYRESAKEKEDVSCVLAVGGDGLYLIYVECVNYTWDCDTDPKSHQPVNYGCHTLSFVLHDLRHVQPADWACWELKESDEEEDKGNVQTCPLIEHGDAESNEADCDQWVKPYHNCPSSSLCKKIDSAESW